MTSQSFESAVRSHSQLVFDDFEGDNYIILNYLGNKFEVPKSSLSDASWDQWEAILLNKRPMQVMSHITRIVGYYSQLNNWNGSKLAELADRHKGDYVIAEVAQAAPACVEAAAPQSVPVSV